MGRFADAWNALRGRTPREVEERAAGMFDSHAIALASGAAKRSTHMMLAAHGSVPGLRRFVERISGSVASVPWGAYRVKRGMSPRSVARFVRSKMQQGENRTFVVRQMIAEEQLEPVEHPALALLDRPNRALTSQQMIATMQAHLDYTGNTFLFVERLRRVGTPFELWPIPPTWVHPQFRINSPVPTHYSISGGRFQVQSVPPENLIWIKNPDPSDPYGPGSGLAASLNNEIDADEQAAHMLAAVMRNRGIPAGVVSFEGAKKGDLKAIEEEWFQKYGGPGNAGRLVFTGAKIDLKQLTQKLIEMDVVGLRKFNREVLTEHFGTPPEIMGRVENSNRATITVALTIFAVFVQVPRLDLLQDALNLWYVPMFGDEDVLLLYENPIPDDWDYRLEAAKAAPWSLELDEWRELAGKPPLPSGRGRVHLVPFTVQAVRAEDLLMATAPAPPAEDENEDGSEPSKPENDDDDKAPAFLLSKQDESRIRSVLDAVRPSRLLDRARSVMRERIVAWFRRIASSVGFDLSLREVRRLVERHLSEWASQRIAMLINETTKRALQVALSAGIAAGEGLRGLEKRVERVFEQARARAPIIGTTEAVRSSNWASWQVHRMAHVPQRVWIHMNDGRVRHAHVLLGGQVRGISDPFVIPSGTWAGWSAIHPGAFGKAELDIGCRCITVPFDNQSRSPEQMGALWKEFDAEIRPWERALAQAIRRGFQDQERDALAALRRAFGGEA